jgi:SAM-dependent methyltransferase
VTRARFARLEQEARERFDPGPFHSRRYLLKSLRERLESVVGAYLGQIDAPVVVDFGGGSMPYRPIFRGRAVEYIGVDFDDNPLARLHVSKDLRTTLGDNTADVVLSTQVLEHVNDPPAYLLECRRVLKPGALLIISTHGHWMYHPDPVDYWRWTKPGLVKLLSEAGFEVSEIHGIMGLAATGIQFVQDGLTPLPMPRLFRLLLVALMQKLAWLVDRLEPATHREASACVYLALARKEPAC